MALINASLGANWREGGRAGGRHCWRHCWRGGGPRGGGGGGVDVLAREFAGGTQIPQQPGHDDDGEEHKQDETKAEEGFHAGGLRRLAGANASKNRENTGQREIDPHLSCYVSIFLDKTA